MHSTASRLAVSAAIALYILVLEPRYQRLNMLRSLVPSQHADLAWMQQQINQHQALLNNRSERNSAGQMPLLTVVEQTATRSGLRTHISRMQPGEGSQVRVWFDDVYFDPWLKWVESLKSSNIPVLGVTVNKAKDRKVNIRVTLG